MSTTWNILKVTFSIIATAIVIAIIAYVAGIAISWIVPLIASAVVKFQDLAGVLGSDDGDDEPDDGDDEPDDGDAGSDDSDDDSDDIEDYKPNETVVPG